MLAYNGLALITEKLQAQRLEEAATTVSVTHSGGSSNHGNVNNSSLLGGGVLSAGTGGGCCSSLANKLPLVTSDPALRSSAAPSNLAVKGKNVWALSLECERVSGGRTDHMTPPPPAVEQQHVVKTRSQTSHHQSHHHHQLSICRHRKPRHTCPTCGDHAHHHHQAPPPTIHAPPKKKHCRSLSVPPPPDASLPGSSSQAKIWRPIALIPLNSNSNSSSLNNSSSSLHTNSSSLSSASSSLLQQITSNTSATNSPVTVIPCGGSNSPSSSHIDDLAPPKFSTPPPTHNNNNYKWLPRLQPSSSTSFIHPLGPPTASAPSPSVPSPASVDSGHFTTSDLATPPGSPVPRPSSAISSSDVSSFSSLSSPWLESCTSRQRLRVLENRSLSLEDRISGTAPSLGHASGFDPCPYRSSSSASGCGGGGEVGVSCGGGTIPRCHSQPCVLHTRRYGKKRRRECDNSRPTLNFNKMTETAYTRSSHRRSEPWSTTANTHSKQLTSGLPLLATQPDLHDVMTSDLSATFCLNPIASSPLDPPPSLDMAAEVALPLTPPEQLSPALPLAQQWGDQEAGETEGPGDCDCRDSRPPDDITLGLFPMNDLDLDQIENH